MMLDTLDLMIEELIPMTNMVSDQCEVESDFKPSEFTDRVEYAIYAIKGGEVYKQVIAILTPQKMKQFMKSDTFERHLYQCLDKLAVKAGYRTAIMNNDRLDKEVSHV